MEMKVGMFLLLLFSSACAPKTGRIVQSDCTLFEREMATHYDRDKRAMNIDTLIKKIPGVYRECILGRDTGYIKSIFGNNYSILAPTFHSRDSLNLKYGMEYTITTPSKPLTDQRPIADAIMFGVDGSGIVRDLRIINVGYIGIE